MNDTVEISIEVEPEEICVRGNALCSEDPAQDRAQEDMILAELEQGNVWAWASVRVVASLHGFTGFDILGCCTYANAADFMRGAYYDSMVVGAKKNLAVNIVKTFTLSRLALGSIA